MSCEPGSDAPERYVTNQMREDERVAFEDHFFACAACLARVQDLQILQELLTPESRGRQPVGRSHLRLAPAGWLAAAAAAILAVAVWYPSQSKTQPARPSAAATSVSAGPRPSGGEPAGASAAKEPSTAPVRTLADLATVTAPRFVALTVRAEADDNTGAFNAGMKAYSAGRYDEAARLLRPLVRPGLDMPHAAFFLGISELMTNHLEAARAALDRAVASGADPYADESHFYLAKIDLRTGDVDGAIRELTRAARAGAGPADEADRLLTALRSRAR